IGDGIRLRAAVENLIDNAIKFTEQGTVGLRVSLERPKRGRARLIFTVSDSGIGLSAAAIKRLFRPFTQADQTIARRVGGAGLGLASSKQIAEAMGGGLKVSRRTDGGSEFQLAVTVDPVTVSDVSEPAGSPSSRPSAVSTLSILCVEDN